MCVKDSCDVGGAASAVLVVDSDPLTCQLVAYLMSRWGVKGDVIESPQDAVAKLLGQRYNLVLIDAELPEAADPTAGLGACREGCLGAVVLMMPPAEASLAAERAAFDRIAKPITAERLREVFVRHSILPADADMTPSPADDRSPLKSQLDDEDMYDLVCEYVAALPSRLADILAAIDSGEWPRVAKLAHQLKGAGGMYGYPDLSQVAALLEQAAKEGHQVDLLRELLAEADVLVERIQRGLSA